MQVGYMYWVTRAGELQEQTMILVLSYKGELQETACMWSTCAGLQGSGTIQVIRASCILGLPTIFDPLVAKLKWLQRQEFIGIWLGAGIVGPLHGLPFALKLGMLQTQWCFATILKTFNALEAILIALDSEVDTHRKLMQCYLLHVKRFDKLINKGVL